MPGTLLHSPAQIVAQLLVDLSLGNAPNVGGSQPTWPVFVDNEPNSPNDLITVTDTLGISFAKDAFGDRNEHHGVQVKVRGGTHGAGWPKARAIAIAFDGIVEPAIVTVGGTDYCVGMVRRTGDVLRLGPEPNSTRRGYTVNAVVYVRTSA